jgi:hypothetical protein
MKRLKPTQAQVQQMTIQQRLEVYSALISRAQLMYKLGKQYDTDRDIYEALGYPTLLTYDDYAARYERQDMAKAVIDRPVEATWRGAVELEESPAGEDTKFEKAWKDLVKRLKLKDKLIRLDKISQVGRYGVLLFGFDGARTETDFSSPIPIGSDHKLAYVKPFGEGNAKIDSYERDPSNPRYGLPNIYNISIYDSETGSSRDLKVHHSRVLHVASDLLESEYEGTPALRSIFNRLIDLEKLTGGSAEMFWRGARPGYQAVVKDDYTLTPEVKENLQDEYDEYEHKLRRILNLEGVELKALETQVESPKDHVDVIIQMISAATGIPKRVLTGSELGELASTQDKGAWLELIEFRRTEYAGPSIIDPFVSKCQDHGILPRLSGNKRYVIKWEDLWSPSDKDQADVGKTRAESVRAYGQSPGAVTVIPPKAFRKYCLGLDENELISLEAEIETELEEEMVEEEREMAEEELGTPPQPGGGEVEEE